MVTLKLTLDDRRVKQMLNEMAQKGRNLMPAMKKASVVLIRSAGRQFHVGGVPKWKPLSDVTVQRRKKKSNVPLRDTGLLMHSWGGRGGKGIRDIKNFSVFVGSRVVYASVHQYGRRQMRAQVPEYTRRITMAFGHKIEPKLAQVSSHTTTLPKIPKRPVHILQKDIDDVKVILTDYILKGI